METELFQLAENLRILYCEESEDKLFFIVECPSSSAICPTCRHRTPRVHSRYCRKVDDLPVAGRKVHFQILLHKWFCNNPDCSTKVFTERLP